MGFRTGAYASVFSVKRGQGNFYDVNITTSHKDRITAVDHLQESNLAISTRQTHTTQQRVLHIQIM